MDELLHAIEQSGYKRDASHTHQSRVYYTNPEVRAKLLKYKHDHSVNKKNAHQFQIDNERKEELKRKAKGV